MSTTATVTVEEIPPPPTPEDIKPGRRVRLVNISPASLNGLTGTTQTNSNPRVTRLDVLLDESSTDFLRRDHRVGNTRKIKVPAPDVTRQLLTRIPNDCMFYAESDS
ncbi:hypothetical protein AB0B04_18830 [Streptomyces xinghaiensis]|uniref:Uncharacterized protein n=2 Tax=Streptomyces TaxID=1883 RepID=A0A3R7EN08_9ACTN|nr:MULTISPECIES: hypothetical protein [Streptomyces]KNE81393.1 hypothetical protein ADZ36_16565 [Streptomyces fradiae]OFA48268.1 hypothetical protein BEN35_19200 [Streptomyces fradiae]PQM20663.1 hypothetical protein Sfr7A_26115 [Streptomyces xinghaiensis]RKM92603.1 hypothetical protein SFRA_024770 [Streptomyces xinghaiensis]RNC70571.1 hypothetical protein DC095_025760 [Streptomyces xinghaiensis]